MAVLTAASLGALHHLDHLVRGYAGWPATGEVNAFTYSLAMYPVVAFELHLAHRGRNMRRYRMTFAVVAFALVAAVHFVRWPPTAYPTSMPPMAHRSWAAPPSSSCWRCSPA